jgi:hypothetical protein
MAKNDGGPAFPVSGRNYGYVEDGRQGIPCDTGMSLRDWFAGMALQGMCVGLVGRLTVGGQSEISAYAHGACNSALVDRAFTLADEAIKRREETR